MTFIGIDLHTNRFTCCYRTGQSKAEARNGREIKTFDLTAECLAAFYQTLAADAYVLVEAAVTAFSFVRLFKDRVKEVITANTYELKQISLARNNTDRIDAGKCAGFLKCRFFPGSRASVRQPFLP